MRFSTVLILTAILLEGCATTPRPNPISMAEVISMTKADLSDDQIIQRINDTRTVFRLQTNEVVMLREEGVSDRVVNYMLDTYSRAVVAEERRNQYHYYEFGYYPYYHHHYHRDHHYRHRYYCR